MDLDGFNSTEAEYHRLRAEATANHVNASYDGVPGTSELSDIDNPNHTKQDVNVGLPASCDPPGPNNPPKQLVWVVSFPFLMSSFS